MDPILDDLTSEQRDAVSHDDGPLLVLAGAGTGKTRVITRRIAMLVRRGHPARRILAITFTNKAAGEMRERTARLVGGSATVSTFHSFGARLLRRHAPEVRRTQDFTIYDDSDQISCVKQAADQAKVDLESWPARTLVSGIASAKEKLLTPTELEEQAITPRQRAVAAAYPLYEKMLEAQNAVDFADLIALPVRLLESNEEVCETWSDWFRAVLVDEYQDTNHAQYRLAMALGKRHGNITVTGDPDQSIYAWRGADISNILDFERDFPKARVVTLTQNFRSTQVILDAANALIAHNTNRKDKSLVAATAPDPGDPPVEVQECQSGRDEAHFVARRVTELKRDGHRGRDITILYRANFQSRPFEEAFNNRRIQHKVVGAVAFYQRKEIKDLIAYLRAIANPGDDASLLRIINVPPRRIGATTQKKLLTASLRDGRSLFEVTRGAAHGVGLGPRQAQAVASFVTLLEELRSLAGGPVAEQLRALIAGLDYAKYLAKLYPDDPDRPLNLTTFVDAASEFDRGLTQAPSAGPDGLALTGLVGFLQHVALVSAVDDHDSEDPDRVTLMTIHTAKGLEFDTVFLVGLEDGVFPNSRSLEERWGEEEERRLAYVALTRAKRRLIVSYARSRSRFGSYELSEPSQFLHESGLREASPRRGRFDEDSQLSPEDDDHFSQRARRAPPRGRTPARPQRRQLKARPAPQSRAFDRALGHPFEVGDRVDHEHFGRGHVLAMTGSGVATRVKVDFMRHGLKTLVLQYARLTKVSD